MIKKNSMIQIEFLNMQKQYEIVASCLFLLLILQVEVI